VPRSLTEMFIIKERMERNDQYKVNIECYMIEIYKNNLEDKTKLSIMEDANSGMVYVQNLTKIGVENMNEAFETYKTGIKNRKVFSTEMNSESSRSHLIFGIVIETINTETN
jgi:hypothetical protein